MHLEFTLVTVTIMPAFSFNTHSSMPG